MNSTIGTISLLAVVALLAACGSTPEPLPDPGATELSDAAPPAEEPVYLDVRDVATEIATHLISGDTAAAESAIMAVEAERDHQEVYRVLFDRAQALAGQRDYDSCIRINRFLVKVYPEERSAQQALLYSLWLMRAQSGKPHDTATVAEIEQLAVRVRADGGRVPVWVDIALTQAAIDGGDLGAARTAMARFTARWDREPPALRAYADELANYLESHSGAN